MNEARGRSPGWLRAAVLLLALWLLVPALRPVHFEGISANTELLARWGAARVARGDAGLFPLIAEFVYASRPLMVVTLAALRTIGVDPSVGFHALVLASFPLFLAASVAAARAFGRGSWFALAAMLVALPGVTTLGYTLNDNIVSGAVAMTALALVAHRNRPWAYAVAGVLIVLAFGFRPDTVLLAPALAGVAWVGNDRLRPLLGRGVAGVAGAALGLALIRWWTGLTLADMLGVLRLFTHEVRDANRVVADLDARIGTASGVPQHGSSALVAAAIRFASFFGPAGLTLSAIGVVLGLVRLRREVWSLPTIKRAVLLYVYPAAVLLYALRFAIVARYFYLFTTPFLLLHGGHAVEWLVGAARHRSGRAMAGALAVLVLILLPPVWEGEADGPQMFAGVAWTPPAWLAWQGSIRAGQARAESFARRSAHGGGATVLSADYNDQYFTLLAFARADFAPAGGQSCEDTAARLIGPGGVESRVVPTDDPYRLARVPTRIAAAAQITAADRCGAFAAPAQALAFFPHGGSLPLPAVFAVPDTQRAALGADAAHMPGGGLVAPIALASYGMTSLASGDLARIRAAASADLGGTAAPSVVRTMKDRLSGRLPPGHIRW